MKLDYFKIIFNYLKAYKKTTVFISLILLLNSICSLYIPSIMAEIIDIGIKQNGVVDVSLSNNFKSEAEIISSQTNYIIHKGFIMLCITLFMVILTILNVYLCSKLSAGISRDIRNDVFSKILNFTPDQFSKFSVSSLITRISGDIESVKNFILLSTRIIIPPLMAIGGIIMSIQKNMFMSLIVCICTCLSVIVVIAYFKLTTPKNKIFIQLIDKFNQIIIERLEGTAVIRVFGNENFEHKKFDNYNNKLTQVMFFISRVTALFMPILSAFINFIIVFVLWYSSVKISCFEMKIGDTMAFLQYSSMVITAFIMLSLVIGSFPGIFVSVERVCEILNIKSGNITYNLDCLDNDIESIEFRDVNFKYPEAKEYILKNINFKIEKGDSIGIIGTIGSGKSTFIKLLSAFYKPTSGDILFNNIKLSKLDLQSLTKKFSYTEQKNTLFSGSISYNLRLTDDDIPEEELWDALKVAQMYDFVKEKGLDFTISQGGGNLSGGQRQRIAIARSLVRKSEVYIFDDCFSELDFKTESEIRKTLKERLKDKITFFISQRIGTIKNLSKIFVFNNGELVGVGNHDELVKNCFVYSEIVKFQTNIEEKI